MTVSGWQRLGGWVSVAANLSDEAVRRFVAIGGDYILLEVLQLPPGKTGPEVEDNYANFATYATHWKKLGLNRVGTWATGWGGDPEVDAATIASFVRKNDAGPVGLDLEDAYTGANAGLMPHLTRRCRDRMPGRDIAVTNIGQFNSAMIWNGRDPANPNHNWGSFYKLGIRWAPEWYSGPGYSKDGHSDPVFCMQRLRDLEAGDSNYADPAAPGHRGLPLSFAKGVLEVTGLENSSLYSEIQRVDECWRQGLLHSPGISLYTLENIPPPYTDLDLLAPYRGKLYL